MQRSMITHSTIAVPLAGALLLAGCDNDDGGDPPSDPAATTDGAAATATAGPDGAGSTGGPDGASQSAGPDVEGGEDGQAAADVARDFFIAMVDADPRACDYLISFSDVSRPMADVESDYESCQTLLPPVLEEEIAAQGLDEEGAAILRAMQITGAEVNGDVAVVDEDNFSDLFADAMRDGTHITLRRVEGQWYVDMDESFGTNPP